MILPKKSFYNHFPFPRSLEEFLAVAEGDLKMLVE